MKISWKPVALLAALVAAGLDCVLLQIKYTSFTGGFLNPIYVDSVGGIAVFVLGLVWFSVAAAALLAPVAVLVVERIPRLRAAQRLVAASFLAYVPLLVLTIQRFKLVPYIGDASQFRWGRIAGLDSFSQGLVIAVGGIALGLVFLLVLFRFVPDRALARLARRGAARVTWVVLVLTAPLVFGLGSYRLQLHWYRTEAGALCADAARFATDFDRDGYGLARWPVDHKPFDGDFYPFAVDYPGNGRDENGIGGDLVAAGDDRDEPGPTPRFVHRPDIILFVLESYRADNLKAEAGGRPVTPVLRAMVADGGVTGPFYSHNGFTVASISHLFSGSLSLTAKDSLIDDLRGNGYFTACISGEDESFGSIDEATGMDRADFFVDARAHKDRRMVESTDPGSLTVSWKVVVDDVRALLERRRGDDQPLFVYINLQDTHFPYRNRELDAIVEAGGRDRLQRDYLNAAANVDRAIGLVMSEHKRLRGRTPACLVVGDHGESLNENGVLGHGVSVTEEQMRALFIVHGLPAACVFPMAHSDIRGLVRTALSGPPGSPTARPDPARWVLQYIGGPDRPAQIAAAFLEGATIYDFRRDHVLSWGRTPEDTDASIAALVTRWEQVVLRRAGFRRGRRND